MSHGGTVFIGACDVSGDQNAAHLATAIRARAPEVRLLGAGGAAMRDAGVEVEVSTTHLSFTGVLGSLAVFRELRALYRRAKKLVCEARPDLVILTDGEIVNVPFAVWAWRRGIPVVFYFPPQVWLWGRWRLPFTVPLIRRVVSAFRDEADLYRKAGADTVWIGHPLRDLVAVNEDSTAALQAHGLDPRRPLVGLMPGSRRSEIRRLSGPIVGAARLLQERRPEIQFALPLANESLRADVEEAVRRHKLRDAVVYRPRSYAVLSRARVVLQCSGTATLETALLGIPSVIAYRCIPIEYVFARLISYVDFIGMPNILLGEMVQPEFFHRNVDAEHLAGEAWSLLTDEDRRKAILSRLGEIPGILGPPGVLLRAADAVVELLPQSPEAVAWNLDAAGGLAVGAERGAGNPG